MIEDILRRKEQDEKAAEAKVRADRRWGTSRGSPNRTRRTSPQDDGCVRRRAEKKARTYLFSRSVGSANRVGKKTTMYGMSRLAGREDRERQRQLGYDDDLRGCM